MAAPPFSAPVPAPLFVDPEQAVPSPVVVARSVTARPFPPPAANFPPPPSDGARPAPPWAHSGGRSAAPKKKTGLIIGGAVGCLFVLVGGFLAFRKFTAVPPSPPVAERAKAPAVVAALVDQAKQQAAAPINEILPAAPVAEVKPEQMKIVEAAVAPAPVPVVVEPPPPPASAAFKAWVDNLRVGGVRPGANPRVMIGSSSYQVGEMVNPQLGIVFDGYSSETRKLTFKDKTGAKVERRN